MRLITLYLRSRLAGRAVAALAVIALMTWLWVRWSGAEPTTITLLPLAMPLAAAAIVGTSAGSPFGESEAAAGRPVGPLRAGHLTGLLVIAALALPLAVLHWNVMGGGWMLVRNLAGFTGLALLATRILGSGLCWALPLGYAVLALLAPPAGQAPAWAWAVRVTTDREAAAIATALLLAGLCMVARSGARDRPGDTA